MPEDNKSQHIALYSICVGIIIVFIATINACFTFCFGRRRRAVFCCPEIADVDKIDKIIATTTITTISIKERRSTMIKQENSLIMDKDKSSSLVRKEDMIITIEGGLNRSFSRKNNINLPTVMEEEFDEFEKKEKEDKLELPSSVLIDSLDQKVDAR